MTNPPARLDPRTYSFRHIKPSATGAVTVLGRTFGFEELPTSALPSSPDMVSGQWTGRLQDAGDWQAAFPNAMSSDGQLWRNRFSESGRLEWVEIRAGGELEMVGCIETQTPNMNSVTVTGHDAWWCLKSQYERDWQCLQAPRDVIERATRVAVPTVADNFAGTTLNGAIWTATSGGVHGPGTIVVNNGVTLTCNGNSFVEIASPVITSSATKWSVSATIAAYSASATGPATIGIGAANMDILLEISTTAAATVNVQMQDSGYLSPSIPVKLSAGVPIQVLLERDGRWLRAFVNSQLVGIAQAAGTITGQQVVISNLLTVAGTSAITVSNILFRTWEPFLMRGTDKGDYVLPGVAATYPNGGLHGRYYNDLDSGSNLALVLNPSKDNPATGQTAPWDQVDPILLANAVPAGSPLASTNWSAKWFGAIWLPFATAGLTGIAVALSWNASTAVRLWVGNTAFGTQIIDQWAFGSANNQFVSLSAANLQGASGWYPIVVESASNASSTTGPRLVIQPLGAGYTDPGGTVLAANAVITCPATSLSPLGCVDERYQGSAYFDMVQQTANAFGHQITLEPMSLESGVFPGQLCPRVREGHDTEIILEQDTSDRVEPIINYSNGLDSTDQASSLQGAGAGIADGTGSQLQAEAVSTTAMQSFLFDMQGWVDASDVAYEQLLAQRVVSQLALQTTSLQNLTGDPRAMERYADTFPLTGVLAKMRWRPGDGVRVWLPDVNVMDTQTRQLAQITRQFGPLGRTSTSITPGLSMRKG